MQAGDLIFLCVKKIWHHNHMVIMQHEKVFYLVFTIWDNAYKHVKVYNLFKRQIFQLCNTDKILFQNS